MIDTRWRTEMNAIHRENREEYISGKEQREESDTHVMDGYKVENREECDT